MHISKLRVIRALSQIAGSLLFVGFLASSYLLFTNLHRLTESGDNRYKSSLLADELRQSSDDLTRMVRTFAATGDARFEKQFWSVLAIRNGEQARPQNYQKIYWDFLATFETAPREDGKKQSLQHMMQEQGITDSEFALLKLAQQKSDELVNLEAVAMRALNNRLSTDDEKMREGDESNRDMALRLLHGPKYHKAKAVIMAPIQVFLTQLDQRTKREYQDLSAQGNILSITSTILVFCLAVVSIFGMMVSTHIAKVENETLSQKNMELDFQKLALDEHAIVSITDTAGNITYVNDKLCQISGYTQQELIGQNHRILKSDEHSPEFYKDLWKTICSGKTWHGTLKNQLKNGAFYWVEATIVPFLNTRGKPFQYVAIRTDVTQQKTAALKARENEIFFENILQTTQQGYWLIDMDKKILSVNAALCRMMGYKASEIIGKSPLDFASPETRNKLKSDIDARTQNPKRSYNVELVRKDGPKIQTIFYATAIFDHTGTMNGSFAFVSDVTDQRENELILINAIESAKAANKVKSEFLAAMSHEIRTPMAGVIGMADLIIDSDLSAEQQDWAQKIKSSGETLLTILNEILDQSKLEAGKLDISPVDFNLSTLTTEITDLFRPNARDKNIDLTIDIKSDVPVNIHADKMRIGQILSNLLSNALKFTEQGSIALSITYKAGDAGNFFLKFAVLDTGIGLNEDTKSKLFSPFSQADSSTSRTYGGTGLGLSISKQLALLMGGEVGVESTLNTGSEFWFTIACKAGKSDVTKPVPKRRNSAWRASRALKILIAEDNPVNQQIISTLLGNLGHEITMAGNGAEAVDCVSSKNIDLILMDIRMPVMDGLQATGIIRAMGPEKASLPIIALTADIAAHDKKEFKSAGVDEVCAKPVELPQLLTTINTLLSEDIHTQSTQPTYEVQT